MGIDKRSKNERSLPCCSCWGIKWVIKKSPRGFRLNGPNGGCHGCEIKTSITIPVVIFGSLRESRVG